MPTYRKQPGGYATGNGYMLEDGWSVFRHLTLGEDYTPEAGEEPWTEELIAFVSTETMADLILQSLQPAPVEDSDERARLKELFWRHVPESIEGYSGRIELLLDMLTLDQLHNVTEMWADEETNTEEQS